MAREPDYLADYLAELVSYGGELLPRGLVMADLERIAREQGHPDPRASAARAMQGLELRRRLDEQA